MILLMEEAETAVNDISKKQSQDENVIEMLKELFYKAINEFGKKTENKYRLTLEIEIRVYQK